LAPGAKARDTAAVQRAHATGGLRPRFIERKVVERQVKDLTPGKGVESSFFPFTGASATRSMSGVDLNSNVLAGVNGIFGVERDRVGAVVFFVLV